MADSVEIYTFSEWLKSSITKEKDEITSDMKQRSKIVLHPLYEDSTDNDVSIPIAPSDIMFTEDSDVQTIKLINYGELPISMNRKLASWSITSFFPKNFNGIGNYNKLNKRGYFDTDTSKKYKYWFDSSDGKTDPYDYCQTLLGWKNNQTPLQFQFQTWGSYYNCQIKKFEFGIKDAVGNVYYQLDFQEYKEYTRYDSGQDSTDYSSDTYYPADGENIFQVCRKLYGSSDQYLYFMNLNGLTTPEIKAGVGYKVK